MGWKKRREMGGDRTIDLKLNRYTDPYSGVDQGAIVAAYVCSARSRGAVDIAARGFRPEGTPTAGAGGFRYKFLGPSADEGLGSKEFDDMKQLLVAASVAAGLAVGAVPAFAQSTTMASPSQAQNYNEARNYAMAPQYGQGAGAINAEAQIGDGSRSGFLREQQELEMTPGYSPDGTD